MSLLKKLRCSSQVRLSKHSAIANHSSAHTSVPSSRGPPPTARLRSRTGLDAIVDGRVGAAVRRAPAVRAQHRLAPAPARLDAMLDQLHRLFLLDGPATARGQQDREDGRRGCEPSRLPGLGQCARRHEGMIPRSRRGAQRTRLYRQGGGRCLPPCRSWPFSKRCRGPFSRKRAGQPPEGSVDELKGVRG